MKTSIIHFLLCHSPFKNINVYKDEGDNSSPISEKAENDNLNNNPDNLFDTALMIILLILKGMIMKRMKIVVNL